MSSNKLFLYRFQDSADSMNQVKAREGHEVLVPLTGSMYVPGVIKDTEKVLVDVGTGYYVEKDIPEAKDYFNRKVCFQIILGVYKRNNIIKYQLLRNFVLI